MSTALDWNPAVLGIPAMLVGQDRRLAELHRLKLEMDGYSVTVVSVEEVIRAVERTSQRSSSLIFATRPVRTLSSTDVCAASLFCNRSRWSCSHS